MRSKYVFLVIAILFIFFSLLQVKTYVLAEQSGSSPESGVTSRIKTIYDSLVTLTHGSDSAGGWGNWGVMWNRIRSAAEWVPTGNASEADVVNGKLFYKDSRTQKTGTLTLSGDATVADVAYGKTFYSSDLTKQTGTYINCGQTFQVTHQASGGVAPVDKTVTYGTVSTAIGGTGTKCWITQNLGASNQATSATDATEDSAGWYWQFNRKQGYKHDGVTRTPNTEWISSIDEGSDWTAENDPCTLELGTGWRIPAWTEWNNADTSQNWNSYNDTYSSVLKLHVGGYLSRTNGTLNSRGLIGMYWSSTDDSSTDSLSWYLRLAGFSLNIEDKPTGMTLRCIKD